MTASTFGQWLEMYWGFALFCIGVIWSLIKMYFDNKNMKKELAALQLRIAEDNAFLIRKMDEHDRNDKAIEVRLTNLIDRNKETTEQNSRAVMDKMEHIGNSIVELKTKVEFLVDKKFD